LLCLNIGFTTENFNLGKIPEERDLEILFGISSQSWDHFVFSDLIISLIEVCLNLMFGDRSLYVWNMYNKKLLL
jgi:hypothetical protein